jgi:hypothetical protein
MMALLMKGKRKVDELRTIPLLTCALETLQKMDLAFKYSISN